MKKLTLLSYFSACFILKAYAQQESPLLQLQMENLQSAGEGGTNTEQTDPELDLMIDMNVEDVSIFHTVPFFSPAQAESLIVHRQRFGPFLCLEELQVVPGFDTAFIRQWRGLMLCSRPVLDIKRFGSFQHEITLRSRLSIRRDNGDDYENYIGDRGQALCRYRVSAGTALSAGFTLEKDAGETWTDRRGLPGDFRSWHIFIRPRRTIRSIALGDFQMQFGQGLTAWSGLSFGKSAEVFQIFRRAQGFRPYASPGESGFMRGVAISVTRCRWQADTWFSRRKLDASLNEAIDPVQPPVSTIIESGLHRTTSELEKKGNLVHLSSGAHLQYSSTSLRIGLLCHYEGFSRPLWPGNDPYEHFDPAGKKFMNHSLNFRYSWKNINLYSEIAMDRERDAAWMAGLLWMPDTKVTLVLHLRDYARDYQCITCLAVSEGSRVQNEKGWLAGWMVQPVRNHRIQGYLDRFHFPWLRYRVNTPSSGFEWLMQWVHTPSRTTEVLVRYRRQERGSSSLFRSDGVSRRQQNIRFHISWMPDRNWEMQTRLEVLSLFEQKNEKAWLIYQEIRYKPLGKAYGFVVRYSLFSTGSYNSRIYAYEQDMPGTFSVPALDGIGRRAYVMARYRLISNTDLWIRYSLDFHNKVGKEDLAAEEIKMQIRVRF